MSAAKERANKLLRQREERDTAAFAEALQPLRGDPGFADHMARAIAAAISDDPPAFTRALDGLVALVVEKAPALALLQRGVDLRRFITQVVLANADRATAGLTVDEAIRRYTAYGPEGFNLPGNSGRVRPGRVPGRVEITAGLSGRERRELLAYSGLFREKDPGGRPQKDADEWLAKARAARDEYRVRRKSEITEEQLAEKLDAVDVRSVRRSLQRCGLSFKDFLALP